MNIDQLIEEFNAIDLNNGVVYKNSQLKREVLIYLIRRQKATIAEIAASTKVSSPKINEIITELVTSKIVNDLGKEVIGIGRKPNFYGLNPSACYFLSAEIHRNYISLALVDFTEEIIDIEEGFSYQLENNEESFEKLCEIIIGYIAKFNGKYSIKGIGITLTGRINNKKGISYSFFNFHEIPVQEVFTAKFNIPTLIENDTRAMSFGEYAKGVVIEEKDVIFINIDEGIGMGIIKDGVSYGGKSGFAGEFGHIALFNNDVICHCGKKGCLETEASGLTMINQVTEAIKLGTSSLLSKTILQGELLTLNHLINAALKDDSLSIEVISNAAEKIGKGISILLNLFNPELVIVGGRLAKLESLLLLPILSSINKHSLHIINADTQFKISKLQNRAGLLGMSLLTRNHIFTL